MILTALLRLRMIHMKDERGGSVKDARKATKKGASPLGNEIIVIQIQNQIRPEGEGTSERIVDERRASRLGFLGSY